MIKKLQALKAKKGFTLVELIVVIAIIGVLAAILVPTMMGYVTSSRVTSVNSTAASIKNSIDSFLTSADTKGYGMLKGSSNAATVTFSINSGTWSATNDSTGAFKTGGTVGWSGNGTGSAAQAKSGITAAESLLAIELADLFPTIDSAYVWAYLEGGKCMYVCYTEDTNTSGAALPVASNFQSGVFSWDGSTAGITSDGLTVGTAPALDLG